MAQDPVIYSSNLVPGIAVNSPILQTPTYTPKMVVLAAAKTLVVGDSGTTFLLNLAGGFTVTLPALTYGLFYRFIAKTAPSTSYLITSAAGDDIVGAVYSASGGAEDTKTTLGDDNIVFVGGTAVLGDSADVWCDGVGWYCRAYCAAAGGLTFTQT